MGKTKKNERTRGSATAARRGYAALKAGVARIADAWYSRWNKQSKRERKAESILFP